MERPSRSNRNGSRGPRRSLPRTRVNWDDFTRAGPGTPMGTLLRRYWQPVAVAAELANGSAVPVRIMSEDLTLYRGATGQPHAVAHRCAHRSTVLHTGWVEDDC